MHKMTPYLSDKALKDTKLQLTNIINGIKAIDINVDSDKFVDEINTKLLFPKLNITPPTKPTIIHSKLLDLPDLGDDPSQWPHYSEFPGIIDIMINLKNFTEDWLISLMSDLHTKDFTELKTLGVLEDLLIQNTILTKSHRKYGYLQ